MKDPWAQGVEWDIAWTDLAPALDRFPKVKSYQKINHFPGMFQIARKNYLARNLQKMKKQFPKDYKFFPKTWLLPYERNELNNQMQQYQKKGTKVNFIVKPECLSQGKGIFITKRIDQIDVNEHLVVQKYLRTPYLIDGYKFDLRIYVLVTNVQPLRIFMHREGLGRFASEKYKLKAFNNPFIHLTNYAINKDNANFTSDEAGVKGHKRSLAAVYKQLEDDGVDIVKLKQGIKDIIVKTLISIQPDLVHNYRTSQPGDIFNNMCFEILGFDVIIDKKGRPLLLEVNHAPSFNDDTALDKQVKRNLLVDTFRLLNVSLQEKQKVLDVLKEINEQRMIGVQKGSKQLQSIQRQDLYIEKLKERDIYENQNLYGYEKLYPPLNTEKEIDQKQMDYYKIFQEHAKKYMMDFKVANTNTEELKHDKATFKRTKTEDRPKKQGQTVTDQIARLTQKRNTGQSSFFSQKQQLLKKDTQDMDKSNDSSPSRQDSQIIRQPMMEDNPQSCMFQVTNQSFEQQQFDTVHNINNAPVVIAQSQKQYQHAIIDQIKGLEKLSRSISPQINLKHIKSNGPHTDAVSLDRQSQSPNSDYRQRNIRQVYEKQGLYKNKTPYQAPIPVNEEMYSPVYIHNTDDKRYSFKRDSSQTLLPSLSKSHITCTVRNEPVSIQIPTQNVIIENNLSTKATKPYDSSHTKHSHRTSNSNCHNTSSLISAKQQIVQYQFPILDTKNKQAKGQRNHFANSNQSVDTQYVQPQILYLSPQKHQSRQQPIDPQSISLTKRQKSQLQIGYKMAYYQQIANQQQINVSYQQIGCQPQQSLEKQSIKEILVIQGQNAQQQKTKKTLNQILTEKVEMGAPPKQRQTQMQNNRDDIFSRLHKEGQQTGAYGSLNNVIQKLEKRGNNVINRLLPQLDKLIVEQQKNSHNGQVSNKTFAYVKVNNTSK